MEDYAFVNSLSKEARIGYQKIAKETKDILRKGYYKVNGRKVDLGLSTGIYEYETVEVYSPNQLNDIVNDTDAFMKKKFYAPQENEIIVCQMEGYDAAKEYFHPLVINFSHPLYPGGGYMAGLDDTEERLCRASSLYQSLSSQKASQMYLYHEYSQSKLNSNFMLISPQVAVFRNSNMQLIDHPYPVSVLSVSCVDKRRPMGNKVTEGEIDAVMKERIRMLFMVAARNMYRNIILSGFSCTSYGHSSDRVARYFYEVLVEEEYIEMFEHIIFALSYEVEKEDFDQFTSIFGPIAKLKYQSNRKQHKSTQSLPKSWKLIQQSEVVTIANDPVYRNYVQARYPFPECNYMKTIQNNMRNNGYAQGVLKDGIPFVAELYRNWQQREAVAIFILPYLDQMHSNNRKQAVIRSSVYSALCDEMQLVNESIGEGTLASYLRYLDSMNLISIQKSNVEAHAQVYYDRAGQKVVAIEIVLINLENLENLIPLQFQASSRKLLEDKKI